MANIVKSNQNYINQKRTLFFANYLYGRKIHVFNMFKKYLIRKLYLVLSKVLPK
jgi:hypothetical protein